MEGCGLSKGHTIKRLIGKEFFRFFEMDVDVRISPMDEVNFFCLTRLQDKYELMIALQEAAPERVIHLCEDEIATGVVAEFDFRGNRKEVFEQLEDLLKFRQAFPYREIHRKELIAQAERFSAHRVSVRNNPFRVKRLVFFETSVKCLARGIGDELLITGLQNLSDKMEEKRLEQITQRHLKKECRCYFND